MSTNTPARVIAGRQASDRQSDPDSDAGLSDQTAARLRASCETTNEPFDGNLTEHRALHRIAALEELHADA